MEALGTMVVGYTQDRAGCCLSAAGMRKFIKIIGLSKSFRGPSHENYVMVGLVEGLLFLSYSHCTKRHMCLWSVRAMASEILLSEEA